MEPALQRKDPPNLEFLSLPRDDGELLTAGDELVSRETTSASEIRVACNVCGAGCLDSVDLDQHAKLHSGAAVYGCAHCKAHFLKPSVLLWHMKQHTPGLRTCSSCGCSLHTRTSLADHGAFHSLNEQTCGVCRENFEGVEPFDAHVLSDDAGKVDGDAQVNVPISTFSEESPTSISSEAAFDAAEEIVSTSSFSNLSVVTNQTIFKIISVIPNSHSCLICQQAFTSHEALFRHTCVHPLIHIAELGLPSCGICKTSFRDAAELHKHVQREAEAAGLNMTATLNEPSSENLILTVLKNNAAAYSGENSYCSEDLSIIGNEEFTESLHVIGENLNERENETDANKVRAKKLKNGKSVLVTGDFYVCSHCNRSFVNVQGLLCHLKMHTEGRPFKCLHCGDSFRFAKRLAIHARVFHKITLCSRCGKEECQCLDKSQANDNLKASYPCLRCKRVFARVTALQRHELTHFGGIVHVCDICGKRFSDRSQFSRHLALHNGRQHRCETCKKDFSSDVILRDHMKTHSDDRPLTCNICGKHFKWRNALRVHLNKHYGSAFHCYVCGRSFTTKSYLMTHVEMHNGPRVKAYSCNFCDKAYFDKSALRKHRATHAENRIRPFACEVCGKSFLANNNLQTHLKLHRNERLHKCDKCGKSFNMKGHLKRHMSVHSKSTDATCDSTVLLPVGDIYQEACEEVVIDSVVAVV